MTKALFKVKCTHLHGSQIGTTASVADNLKKGDTYLVRAVEQHSWHTRYLIGRLWYNSVNFEKIYKLKIAIDVDGVLSDTVSGILPMIRELWGRDLEYGDINEFNFPIGNTDIGKIITTELKNNKQFTLSLKHYEGAPEVVSDLYRNNLVTILTARPPESDPWTKMWLEDHHIPYDYYMNSYGKKKTDYKWDVLIDDYHGNFLPDIKDRYGILIKQPWSIPIYRDFMYNVSDFNAAMKVIKILPPYKK